MNMYIYIIIIIKIISYIFAISFYPQNYNGKPRKYFIKKHFFLNHVLQQIYG